jgi:hypothetical protein
MFMFDMYRLTFILSLVVFIMLGNFLVRGQRSTTPVPPDQEIKSIAGTDARPALRAQRFREGTAFKGKHVFFRQTGDRTVLYTVEDNQRFMCLENLALERILTTIQAKPERRYWKIDGEFTEFRGDNLVLIRRAVVAQAPADAAPAVP